MPRFDIDRTKDKATDLLSLKSAAVNLLNIANQVKREVDKMDDAGVADEYGFPGTHAILKDSVDKIAASANDPDIIEYISSLG